MDISVRSVSPLIVEDRSWLGDADGTQATRSITLATSLFTKATHFPLGVLKSGTVLARVTAAGATQRMYGPYAGRTNEIQTVTITGGPTGGTFTLTYDGAVTAAIAFNATAAAVQAALEGLPNIGRGDVLVTGAAGGPYSVTFTGALAGTDVAAMVATGTLTGGVTPAVAVTVPTAGGSAAVNGLEIPAGFLFNSIPLETGGPNKGAPLMERGFVIPAALPANAGLDSFAKTALGNHFIWRNR